MGSELGVPDETLLAVVGDWAADPHLDGAERLALEYADAITMTDRDVEEELFERLRAVFNDDEVVELTMTIAWENASSKFNRALRLPAQGLWQREPERRDVGRSES